MELQTVGSKVLRKVATRVAQIDDVTRVLCYKMIEVMNKHDGIGIAAPQVGISKRIIVVKHFDSDLVMINPEITKLSEEGQLDDEGCLSCPNTFGKVWRSNRVHVKYRNMKGKPCFDVYNDLTARIIQHEVDHLNGILFVDHLDESVPV